MKILFIIFSILLATGLIRPWRVLWFINTKNRMNVLLIYGIPWLIVLLILIAAGT